MIKWCELKRSDNTSGSAHTDLFGSTQHILTPDVAWSDLIDILLDSYKMSRVTFSRCISQQTDHGRRRQAVCRDIRDLSMKNISSTKT